MNFVFSRQVSCCIDDKRFSLFTDVAQDLIDAADSGAYVKWNALCYIFITTWLA